jgi:broad specificity phosphatase PhoE
VTPTYPESESDMRARCGLAIKSLLACRSPGDTNIVIVTHGSPVSAILQALAEVLFFLALMFLRIWF